MYNNLELLLEHIIGTFQERPLPYVKIRNTVLPNISGKIDTIIGMRRTGKTYFLYQFIQQQLTLGIPKQRILYINFDDERLLPLKTEQLHLIPDTYYRLFPKEKKNKCFFCFDEIQNINGWELFIRRLLDQENIHIILTGSSAKLLSKEIATSLRGRAIATEIFPFGFKEILKYENPELELNNLTIFTDYLKALFSNQIRQYLAIGGFPEIQDIAPQYHLKILQEYVNVVIMRDIVERYNIANIQVLHVLVKYILSNPATFFSVNKLYNDLKSQGISCTKNALYEYLEHLTDAYLIYQVFIYTRSERIKRTNLRKIYVIDPGLINAFLPYPQTNIGLLLENFVYLILRTQTGNIERIEYYKTKNNTEVDFITTSMQGVIALYQVALNIDEPTTRNREIRSLELAMQECNVRQATIITLDHRETLTSAFGIIEIIPSWQFAIQNRL